MNTTVGHFMHSALLACVVLAAAAAQADSAADSVHVVDGLEKLGAKVTRGDEGEAVAVDLVGASLTPSDLQQLGSLKSLRRLSLGPIRRDVNAQILDVTAPRRAKPGDPFTVTAHIRAYGMRGEAATVVVSQRNGSAPKQVSELRIALPADGRVRELECEVVADAAGEHVYAVDLIAPKSDADPRDNRLTAAVFVADRKQHVLLLASGPCWDFRYLRNVLRRDDDLATTVLLQSDKPGGAREGVLHSFPETLEDLSKFDCIVAFDPDWAELNEEQAGMLQRWVSERAGGLILAGAHASRPLWAERAPDDKTKTLKSLYPVALDPKPPLDGAARTKAWPLQFTKSGRNAEFLRLDDGPRPGKRKWSEFSGFYDYCPTGDAQPTATVYAHYNDPGAKTENGLPVYFVSWQLGRGRVFFQAAAEMWRTRNLGAESFERHYLQLIQWATEGQQNATSARGAINSNRARYTLGEVVKLHVQLTDSQHLPLEAERINARLVAPSGAKSDLELSQGESKGTYTGSFPTGQVGEYRLTVDVPDSDDEKLLHTIRVRPIASKTPVGDAALEYIGQLQNLETLRLPNCQVSDRGLQQLQALKNLRHLYLGGTQVTDQGVAELKKSLPKVEIVR